MIDEKPERQWCVASGDGERGEDIHAFESSWSHPSMDVGYDGGSLIFMQHYLQSICVILSGG